MIELSPILRRFVELVRERTGNIVPRARFSFLEEVVDRRARALEEPDGASYVKRLLGGELREEWEKLIPLITIKESYFFRAPQHFAALESRLLPRLLKARASERKLRIWSAACARGEEPATLAIVLAEQGVLGPWDWSILATDVDEEALAAAARGLYGERAVSQVPPRLLERYFLRRGKLFELHRDIRSRISYQRLNLADPPYHLPEPSFDLILVRNVLIYFDRPLQRRVITQAARALAPAGYLFLGASETLWQIHEMLAPLDLGSCFCYQHPQPGQGPTVSPQRLASLAGTSAAKVPVRRPSVVGPGPSLYPSALSQEASPPAGGKEAPTAAREARGEETAAAEQADTGSPGPGLMSSGLPDLAPPDIGPGPVPSQVAQDLLLEAAGALRDNRLASAEELVDRALAADPSEPTAHALDGFLADLRGETEDAVAAYRAALYLEPALYQVRLLLADCQLRLGLRDRAAHQYREVLASLAGGRQRELVLLDDLPLPDRQRAERRCRQILSRR